MELYTDFSKMLTNHF